MFMTLSHDITLQKIAMLFSIYESTVNHIKALLTVFSVSGRIQSNLKRADSEFCFKSLTTRDANS